jgi:phosphopantetheinyl transferase
MDQPRLRWAVCTRGWQPGEAEADFLLSLLPPEERAQCERFRLPDDRHRALLSRLLARRAASAVLGLAPSDADVRRTRGGKPYVANALPGKAEGPAPNWNYSVSHEVGVRDREERGIGSAASVQRSSVSCRCRLDGGCALCLR